MAEVAFACENHGDRIVIRHADGLLVADGAAGLDDGGDTYFGRGLHTVCEGEEGV